MGGSSATGVWNFLEIPGLPPGSSKEIVDPFRRLASSPELKHNQTLATRNQLESTRSPGHVPCTTHGFAPRPASQGPPASLAPLRALNVRSGMREAGDVMVDYRN